VGGNSTVVSVGAGAAGASSVPGVYRRDSRWVAVYREDGVHPKESPATAWSPQGAPRTFREAREIKLRDTAEGAARRAGPTLHSYALAWVDHAPVAASTTSSTITPAASTGAG
jgi:hypothetical protein